MSQDIYISVQPDSGAQLNINMSSSMAGVLLLNGRDGIVTIDKNDVGLSNVENVSITGTSGYLQNQIDNLDLNYASQAEIDSLSGAAVLLYGNQNVTGVKNFISRPTVNGTGVLLSGEAAGLPTTIVYTTGSQTISGLKNFSTRPTVNNTGIVLIGEAYPLDNPSGFITGVDLSNYATVNNLELTGQSLDNKINNLSGVSVLIYGDQYIDGQKIFRGEVRIKDLYVTGTETIVNTINTNVGSNYILLNATGGAIDAGIFIVTGSGLTGISDTGAIIGYDVPANRWVFGNASRDSDLSQLEKIAGITDITNYSGYASNTFATISNLETTGSNLNQKVDDLSGVSVLVYGNQTISGQKIFTDDTDFQNNISVSGFYNFDIANTGQPFDGQMNWNPDYGTVQIGMNAGNVINPVGFKSFYRVKAAENIRKGKVVMALGGVGNSEYILAREAQNIGNSGQLIMGVSAEEILANNFGDVVAFGSVRGVDTSTYPQDSILYYDTSSTGGFTNIPPEAPNTKVLVALNTTSNNNGIVFVRVTAGSELGGTDSNVKFSTLQNNDIIIYNTGSGFWFNSGVNFGSFYTKDNPSGFITGIDLSNYVTGNVVRPSETGNFITADQTGNFYPSSNPNGYITGLDTSNFYTKDNPSGFITGVDLSNYYTKDNPSGFITGVDLSNYISYSQTGNFYTIDNPSGFLTGVDLSNYVTKTNGEFTNRPTVNGTGVLLSGEAYSVSNPSGFINNINVSDIIKISMFI